MNIFLEGSVDIEGTGQSLTKLRVDVNRGHCHLYAICEQEAPEVFVLTADSRLEYNPKPDPQYLESVRQAARVCPMQAIRVEEKWR